MRNHVAVAVPSLLALSLLMWLCQPCVALERSGADEQSITTHLNAADATSDGVPTAARSTEPPEPRAQLAVESSGTNNDAENSGVVHAPAEAFVQKLRLQHVYLPTANLDRWLSPPHWRGPTAPPELAADPPTALVRASTMPSAPTKRLLDEDDADAERQWIERWAATVMTGTALDPTEQQQRREELDTILAMTTLSAAVLCDVGLGVAFVEGNAAATPWLVAAIAQLERDLAGQTNAGTLSAQQAAALSLMHRMIRPVYDGKDVLASARLYELLSKWEPQGSYQARNATIRVPEMYYAAGREDRKQNFVAARKTDAILARAQELGLDETQLAELNAVCGYAMFQAQAYDKAVPYLKNAAETSTYYTAPARTYLLYCLSAIGDENAARHYLKTWTDAKMLNQEEMTRLPGVIEQGLDDFEQHRIQGDPNP